MGKNSTHAWAITKAGPEPLLRRDRTEYEHHARAQKTYSQWMSGFSEQEIADFFQIEVEDVLRDVQHCHQILPVRTVLAHLNDRNRILIQRAEGEKYRRLLSESLSTPVEDYLQSGVSPVGTLKEYREATGMVTKAEPMIQVNTQINSNTGNGNGITSAEDAIRRALSAMAAEESPVATVPADQEPCHAAEPLDGDPDDLLDGQDNEDEPA
jgi:hypothetical protein